MLHRVRRFRRLLATTLLVVFANVLAGQCWCAARSPRPGAARGPKAAHGCCRAMAAAAVRHGASGGDSGKASRPAHKSSRSHGCCRDKAASLLSSLGDPAGKQVFDLAPALPATATTFHFPAVARVAWGRPAAVRPVPQRHLPPKIPDIRIFIRSLTV